MKDGLWDVHSQIYMVVSAEETAKEYEISRSRQDNYTIESFHRAQKAWRAGKFAEEIAPVTNIGKKGETVVWEGEGYQNPKEEKVPTLKLVLDTDEETVIVAKSSKFNNNGASALVLETAN